MNKVKKCMSLNSINIDLPFLQQVDKQPVYTYHVNCHAQMSTFMFN